MSGFVYIWYDRKHKRFYIGSHWGNENDGYVCSSGWMSRAYNKRPQDFKRRILERIGEREQINEAEHRWLQMIKKEELKVRYYNLRNYRFGHWSHGSQRLSVGEKISAAQLGRKLPEEWKNNIGNALRGRPRRKPITEEAKQKMRLAKLGRKYSDEHIDSIRQAKKRKRALRNEIVQTVSE